MHIFDFFPAFHTFQIHMVIHVDIIFLVCFTDSFLKRPFRRLKMECLPVDILFQICPKISTTNYTLSHVLRAIRITDLSHEIPLVSGYQRRETRGVSITDPLRHATYQATNGLSAFRAAIRRSKQTPDIDLRTQPSKTGGMRRERGNQISLISSFFHY